jgi:hypothetical protein
MPQPKRTLPKRDKETARLLFKTAEKIEYIVFHRLDRIEDAVERLANESRAAIRDLAEETRAGIAGLREENRKAAEENNRFKLLVRGAIESLAKSAAKHDKAIASLEKQFQAYLVSRPQ